ERPGLEGGLRVVTRVEEAPQNSRARRPSADAEVGREARTPVRRVRRPDLEVVVRDAVDVAAAAGPEVVPRVVPGDGHVAARLIEGDCRVVLAVRCVVVVQLDR